MNKALILSLLMVLLANAATASDDMATASSPDETTPLPAAKPHSAVAPTAPKNEPAANQQVINLETAYKREYTFLEAQKRELVERLKRYQSGTKNEEHALNNRINVLERGSVDRSAKIDQLNQQLIEAERTEAAVGERNDALDITYSQAEAALKVHAIELPATLADGVGNDLAKVGFCLNKRCH